MDREHGADAIQTGGTDQASRTHTRYGSAPAVAVGLGQPLTGAGPSRPLTLNESGVSVAERDRSTWECRTNAHTATNKTFSSATHRVPTTTGALPDPGRRNGPHQHRAPQAASSRQPRVLRGQPRPQQTWLQRPWSASGHTRACGQGAEAKARCTRAGASAGKGREAADREAAGAGEGSAAGWRTGPEPRTAAALTLGCARAPLLSSRPGLANRPRPRRHRPTARRRSMREEWQ